MKTEIAECLEKNEPRSYIYLEQNRNETTLLGIFSNHDAAKFVKMIMVTRPAVYKELQGWDGKRNNLNRGKRHETERKRASPKGVNKANCGN